MKLVVGKLGYSIRRIPVPSALDDELSPYHSALLSLLSCRDKLRIVVVGANDGAGVDPIYRFVTYFPGRTEILLIEPQGILIEHLKRSYGFHPAHSIFNGAIGPEGVLKLYSVSEEFWNDLDVPYATGWPHYLAPTGVTSVYREHVYNWLERHLRTKAHINDAIEESTVTSTQLLALLEEIRFPFPIDVLQVDAEGYDDSVIYNCGIETTKPRLIHFESASLDADRWEQLVCFLSSFGYHVWRQNRDALAVLPRHQEPSSRCRL